MKKHWEQKAKSITSMKEVIIQVHIKPTQQFHRPITTKKRESGGSPQRPEQDSGEVP